MTLEANRINEQIAQVDRDLAEINEQVASGEIDATIADRLRSRYTAERTRLVGDLSGETIADPAGEATTAVITPRRLAGAAILVIAAAGLAFGVIKAVGGDEPAVEGVAADVAAGQGVNLDDITNEQMEEVVAENPDIAPMRLALADRYFAEGDFSSALTHYMYVLENLGVQDPTALANVGWMTFLSGVPDVAESFVERSLETQPDGGIAFWYLANIRFFGLDDPGGAAEPLERLLAYDNLPDELRIEAEDLLAQTRTTP